MRRNSKTSSTEFTENDNQNRDLPLFSSAAAPSIVNFQAWQVGFYLQPNTDKPSYHKILSASGNTVVVEGNCAAIAVIGITGHFRVVAPPKIDGSQGGRVFDPVCEGSQTLWAGYRYLWPIVGHLVNLAFTSNQPGPDANTATWDGNAQGQYHCWNRVYDVLVGRWTGPDPAKSPWGNLQDYCGYHPIWASDKSGLEEIDVRFKKGVWNGVWQPSQPGVPASPGTPESFTFSNLSGGEWDGPIGDTMEETLDHFKYFQGDGHCVKTLQLESHGSPHVINLQSDPLDGSPRTGMRINADAGGVEKNAALASREISAQDFGRFIKPYMCCKCEIRIHACNVGLGPIPAMLADATGCTVRSANGYIQQGVAFDDVMKNSMKYVRRYEWSWGGVDFGGYYDDSHWSLDADGPDANRSEYKMYKGKHHHVSLFDRINPFGG